MMILTSVGDTLSTRSGGVAALSRETYLRSANGRYSLTVSGQGEAALRHVETSAVMWRAVPPRNLRCELRLSANGRLSLQSIRDGAVFWSSPEAGTVHAGDAMRAVLTDLGVLEVSDGRGKLLWSSAGKTSSAPLTAENDADASARPQRPGAIGVLEMLDDEGGKFRPYDGGAAIEVLVYRKSGADTAEATLYPAGRAADRFDVILERASATRYHVLR
jgi:hypothetical protein